MPIGTKADFKIYDEQFFAGATEVILQNTNVFNTASANGIQLIPARRIGRISCVSCPVRWFTTSHNT